jgi:hypothetical protein
LYSPHIPRIKEEFSKETYHDKISLLKDIQKSFEFPQNPAYTSKGGSRNLSKLKYLSEYARENKIPMSNNEELIMNLDLTKMQHKLWKEQMSQMYDTQPEFKTDVE